jgi:phage terminase small subunit
MTRVRERVSVHPKTVTKVSTGEVKRRRRTGARTHPSSAVTITAQHPALRMAHALGIDPSRIEMYDEPDNPGFLWGCIIHNNPAF